MEYYFSGIQSKQELTWLLEAGIRRILVDPVQWRQVVSKAALPDDMQIALDSGAYRAFKKGQEHLMPLAEYESIAMSYPFDFVVSPDVIGDWQRSYEQWQQAIELIEAPLVPVWQWGAPMDILKEMLDASALVGVGGCQPWLHVNGANQTAKHVRKESVHRLTQICEQYPGRLHVFGLCWEGAIEALKGTLASGDSSHYLCGARKGQVIFVNTRTAHLSKAPARVLTIAKTWSRPERCINNAKAIASFVRGPSLPPLAVA